MLRQAAFKQNKLAATLSSSVQASSALLRGTSASLGNHISSTKFQQFNSVRHNSTLKDSKDAKPVFTKLSDENDPERNLFFKYTWGTWLKNDKQEKEKRFTSFSIEGLNKVLQDILAAGKTQASAESELPKPIRNNTENVVTFSENIKDVLGDVSGTEPLLVKTMISIHEGKHNKVYKLDLSNGKSVVLRVPYKLLTEYGTSRQIQSEAATLDFARHKLGIRVPKLVSYGMHSMNPVRAPFMLMEYLEGDLLMKKWNPAIEDTDPKHRGVLNEVIEPLSAFQKKLLSVEFNYFGSLYFHDDVNPQLQLKGEPYEGETDVKLQNRWRIGLSVDRNLWRNKEQLKPDQFNPLLGPIDSSEPYKLISNAASIEIENLRTRLALSDADASSKVENIDILKNAIDTCEKVEKIAPLLINDKTEAIPHIEKLYKPRLHHPDIDPMNVIISPETNELVFLDFENVSIKPFVYTPSPNFINYEGYKIYNLQEIENFDKLPDIEKYQYSLMYKRTRNQFLWELALNNNNKELIASVSPYLKELKSPYTRLLQARSDQDLLFVEEALLRIKHNWVAYVESGLVKGDNNGSKDYPVTWTDAQLQFFEKKFTEHQKFLMSNPFASTGGWVPQDMFERLLGEGKIEKVDGEYKIKKLDI